MSRGREQQRQTAVTPRHRGRCFDFDDEPPCTSTGRRCRSCAAAAIADCVALGCCPCAVVSLLALALVKAPLVVGRRCVGRLRRRRLRLLLKKLVRDVAASAAASTTCVHEEKGVNAKVVAPGAGTAPDSVGVAGVEAELAWLEEMYRVGHWGFGRVSLSAENPVKS